jgi:hypothetical protein
MLKMPSKTVSQCLLLPGDEALPQTSSQNQPPTENLSTITEGHEHAAFNDVP